MIVALCSAKGSPGVTTTAALLALHWPRGACTLLEADPSGGSLVARWAGHRRISIEPGLISLAATREPIDASTLHTHSQPVTERVRVLAAPPNPGQARAALTSLGDNAANALTTIASALDMVIDCGRFDPASPSTRLLRNADITLLLTRPRLDDVAVLAGVAASLRDARVNVQLVCVGNKPYLADEVATHVGLPLAGVIAEDARNASQLVARESSDHSLRKLLARSIRALGQNIAAGAPPPAIVAPSNLVGIRNDQ